MGDDKNLVMFSINCAVFSALTIAQGIKTGIVDRCRRDGWRSRQDRIDAVRIGRSAVATRLRLAAMRLAG